MYWASRCHRESAKLLFFSLPKSRHQNLNHPQTNSTPSTEPIAGALHQPMKGATALKHYYFPGTALQVNCWWQPTTKPNVPPALFWHLLAASKMLLLYTKSESLLLELKEQAL